MLQQSSPTRHRRYWSPNRMPRATLFYEAFLAGTFAPFLRASERPIAIACLRLLTAPPFPPLPERSVPFFSRRTALSTDLPAALPYLELPDLREPLLFLVATFFSSTSNLYDPLRCPKKRSRCRRLRHHPSDCCFSSHCGS